MAWFMQWLSGHGMVYSIAWRAWHGIWYVLVAWHGIGYCLARYGTAYGVAWQDDMYMVWPGRHGMVYGMVCRLCHDI